jgi:hypothetical protein
MRASQLTWMAVAAIAQLSSLTIAQAQQKGAGPRKQHILNYVSALGKKTPTSLSSISFHQLTRHRFFYVCESIVADDYLVTSLPDLSAEESAQIKQYAG